MFINENKIETILNKKEPPSDTTVAAVLKKAKALKRLSQEEVAILIQAKSDQTQNIFKTAFEVKNLIYGNRIVFFAPMYISNFCNNQCRYCAFSAEHRFKRHALSMAEIKSETEILLKQGHKRILLVAGESYPQGKGLDYILEAIDAIYDTRAAGHNIRRINVNIAPLNLKDFKRLKTKPIGTYQLFQETYHKKTYHEMHLKGPKSDYENRLYAIDRAFEAGFDDVGIGVLFGLADWRFEVLALMQHIEHLEAVFGMGPHTISVPRIEPAIQSAISLNPPAPVSDNDFKKMVAIIRLAVPYTGMILSTRENPETRREVLQLGVSQLSAGSRTNPGGYGQAEAGIGEQFSLGDHRSLDEVIYDLLKMDFLPSFCTACYRTGRTGLDFMEYAKPGAIRKKCEPNGLITFKEYLVDFASKKTHAMGQKKLKKWTAQLSDKRIQDYVTGAYNRIENSERDIYI